MPEWMNEFDLQGLFLLAMSLISTVIALLALIQIRKTFNVVGRRTLSLKGTILLEENKRQVEITVINKGFVNAAVKSVGLLYRGKHFPLSTVETNIQARNCYKVDVELESFIALLKKNNDNKRNLTKVLSYAEDTVGIQILRNERKIVRSIKKMLKQETLEKKREAKKARRNEKLARYNEKMNMKAEFVAAKAKRQDDKRKAKIERRQARLDRKIQAKKYRMETGKYNFREKVGIFFRVIFHPFGVIIERINNRMNDRLKLWNENRIEKNKARAQQNLIREELKKIEREKRQLEAKKRDEERKKQHEETINKAKAGLNAEKPHEPKVLDRKDLENLKVQELKNLAKDANIDGYTQMKKPELIDALSPEPAKEVIQETPVEIQEVSEEQNTEKQDG